MRAKRKFGVTLCSVLLAVFTIVAALVPASTAYAGNCEEWYTRRGLVDKAGDNENGYTIGSRGDTSFTVCRYGEQIDILATEIQFSFKAWPRDPNLTDSWAYITFGRDFKESSFLATADKNAETGRIQLLLYQKWDGQFWLHMYNGQEMRVLHLSNFDFDAVHTISFMEKAVGTYLVFDGQPYTDHDFSSVMEPHIGENAGKTYFAVGGYEAYEFSNMKIVPIEKQTASGEDYVAPNNPGGGKLGDLDSDEEEEVDAEPRKELLFITIGTVVTAVILASVLIVMKRKSKSKQIQKEENGGMRDEKV